MGASQRTEICINEYAQEIEDITAANPFDIHIIFLNVAISAWRPYITSLLAKVTDVVSSPL
jgi:hypothetical protein